MDYHQPSRLMGKVVLVLSLLIIVGCEESTETKSPALVPSIVVPTLNLGRWSEGRFATVRDSVRQLEQASNQFLDNPSADSQTQLQDAWRNAHERYHEIKLIIEPSETDHRIDAWPIAAGFLDALPEYPNSGLINDDTLNIDKETIIRQHQITDDSEVALGFHAIEYLAFGRSYDDFLVSANNGDRRREMLKLITAQLVIDVTAATDEIATAMFDLGYRQVVDALIPSTITLIDEFDEWQDHSPFSGDSHNNLRQQMQRIRALLSEQTGLSHYFVDLDSDKAMALSKTLEQLTLLTETPESTELNRDEIRLLLSGFVIQLEDISALAADR